MDVCRAAAEYSQTWNGIVTLSLRPFGTDKKPDMCVVAQLYAEQKAIGVAKPLASASVSIRASGGGDIAAVCLGALYELDKQVYRQEMGLSPIGG
jgi:hypothetical protein